MTDQHGKAVAFAELHRLGTFVEPNPWDTGSARALSRGGFSASATTSADLAFGLGRPDGAGLVNRDEALAGARSIVEAPHLPVSADLDDTVRRPQAFSEASADVLSAPALPSLDAVTAVCSSVDKPVNVLAAGPVLGCSVAELSALGGRRISRRSALPRAALTAVLDAAAELAGPGTFAFAKSALGYAESNALPSRS